MIGEMLTSFVGDVDVRGICKDARLDLTLECVRRYYAQIESPLTGTFVRYNDFFRLFKTFPGFIDFFLFQDWVDNNYSAVKIAPPFDGFMSSPVPKTLQEYLAYRESIMELLRKRNQRIAETCS